MEIQKTSNSQSNLEKEQTCGKAREGEGGTNGESSIDMYTLPCAKSQASLVAQRVKHLSAMQETQV